MPGTTPATSQLDWLSSTTAMIVLFWSRATRDLLKSFGWGIAALHRLMQRRSCHPRRPPHSVYWSVFDQGVVSGMEDVETFAGVRRPAIQQFDESRAQAESTVRATNQ